MEHIIKEPYSRKQFADLKAGDRVLLTGTVYMARDAAHKKMVTMLEKGEKMPFELENAIVYYAGPTPAKPGYPIGSAGPTTSYRMDPYTPALLKEGLRGMIGKGPRSQDTIDSMIEQGAVYFAAIGGAAALIAQSVTCSETVAFAELGTEAVRKVTVKDMPLIVAIDNRGENIYCR